MSLIVPNTLLIPNHEMSIVFKLEILNKINEGKVN